MAVYKWQVVCSCCGRGSTTTTKSDSLAPSGNPSMPGTCPSSPDKKHKPKWVRI